jgi:hypothetical protein
MSNRFFAKPKVIFAATVLFAGGAALYVSWPARAKFDYAQTRCEDLNTYTSRGDPSLRQQVTAFYSAFIAAAAQHKEADPMDYVAKQCWSKPEEKISNVMGRLIAIRAAAWGEDSKHQRRFLHVDDGGDGGGGDGGGGSDGGAGGNGGQG